MAANGPSQRKTSVSTLVYSTLGLGLLPNEEKERDWVVLDHVREGSTPKDAGKEPINVDSAISRPHAQRTSATSVNDTQRGPLLEEETEAKELKFEPDGTGRVLSRFYSSPASSLGRKNRLAFTSKSGAGSISTKEQATLPEQSSAVMEDGALSPVSPVTKQLQGHISAAEEISSR